MRKLLLVVLLLLSSPAIGQSNAIDKRFDEWRECLRGSFAVQKTETRDANFAAERSFQACSSEEQALRAVSGAMPESAYVQLKSTAKRLLLQER